MTSEQEIAVLKAENETLRKRVVTLEDQLYWLRKKVFGKMSEKNLPLDPAVLSEPTLFGEEMTEEEKAALEAEVAKANAAELKVIKVKTFERKPRKAIDTGNLEVKEEHIYPEVANKEDYTELDPEITEVLVYVSEQLYVRRIIRHKLVLKSNLQIKDPERNVFEMAPLPAMPLPKCMASASLLTDIIIQKFFYHMPFYRVIQKYKELGDTISNSTMNDWYAATCEKLKLLYDILKREVLSKDYIQVDESTLPVIDNEKHRAVKGYMWCTRAVEDHQVVFHYDMGSRGYETARKLLRGYRGTIQADGYGAYDQFEGDPRIQVIGCWAHARRKFSDAIEEDNRKASEGLIYINKLYHIENEAREAGTSAEALKDKRRKESYPVILEFEKWMYDTVSKVSENSRMGKAISYTLPLLPRLSRYVNDGRFRIDNNLVENAIRPLALGRKNFLFCGNHDAAIRAAIIYSLIGSCKAAGVDPRQWMERTCLCVYPDARKTRMHLLNSFRTTGQESTQIRRKRSNPELFGTKKTNLQPSCAWLVKSFTSCIISNQNV
ncbi:MAG: IS66 family transposase [Candidatus Bathyarchaeota archaeon]|nr:IS66 family transposase [Candidatus Bathyarchaeota archaeon]